MKQCLKVTVKGPCQHTVVPQVLFPPQRLCIVSRSQGPQEPSSSSSSSSESPASTTTPYVREFNAFGTKVIESNQPFTGPEDEKDFWEEENFQKFGEFAEKYFLPVVVLLGLAAGGLAASTYNEGADVFIKTPTGPEDTVELIPASALATPSVSAPPPAASD